MRNCTGRNFAGLGLWNTKKEGRRGTTGDMRQDMGIFCTPDFRPSGLGIGDEANVESFSPFSYSFNWFSFLKRWNTIRAIRSLSLATLVRTARLTFEPT